VYYRYIHTGDYILVDKKEYYVSNDDLVKEIIRFKENGVASEELGKMLITIATNFSSKGMFAGYTWRQDMISEAVLTCIRYVRTFDENKSNKAFSYVTQMCYHAFIAYIKKQKTHSNIKDTCYRGYSILVDGQKNTTQGTDYRDIIHYKSK